MKKFLILTTAALALTLSACKVEPASPSAAQQAEKQNVQAQQNVKARATNAVPVPNTSNFQARENLAEFMRRVDEKGKVWYVYERAPMSGEILGMYTSSSYPQSVCTFMTPPEEIKTVQVDWGEYRGTAAIPTSAIALDGVYYKGGDCPDFFFDYTTGAMIVLDADAVTIAVDQPLDVQAPNFSFVVSEKK
jgi:hypothetical protein